MFVRIFLLIVAFSVSAEVLAANDSETAEVFFFYDDTQPIDPQSQVAIRAAIESGFRIREIAARRFPNLTKRFQIRRFPSLVLLRRNQLADRHEGRFTFARIREMFARARENRSIRQERIREMLAGSGRVNRSDVPESTPPMAPRYIHTSTNNVESDLQMDRTVPKPLDRNGRFAVAHVSSPVEKRAFDATVRLRVVDPGGTSHGTGTVIHSQGLDALVLTCGHIFRESRGLGRIEADVSFSSQIKTVSGRLISFDSNAHDIALLTIRTPYPMVAVRISRDHYRGQANEDVFTIGCDKGSQPTIRRSHYKRAAIYDGTEKYDVYGRPVDGRSGGGLFNFRGELIGVCNAAAVHVDEGIYSGLRTIYRQLALSHLDHLFNDSYWNELSTRDSLVSFGEQTEKRSDPTLVQFQELPANPALAFGGSRGLPSEKSGNSPLFMASVPSNMRSLEGASFKGEALEKSTVAESGIRPPRIPAFQSSKL